MKKNVRVAPARKNGRRPKEKPKEETVSKLGKELQKLADEYAASGAKLLNRRELYREIAERRGCRGL